jgi:hypothetical protein
MDVQTQVGAAPAGTSRSRWVAALLVPLLVAATAYLLWWLSDSGWFGGMENRAIVGWGVVGGFWIVLPIVVGIAWSRLGGRQNALVALGVALVIAAVVAALFWRATVGQPCGAAGQTRTPADWIGPAAYVGGLVGFGIVVPVWLGARRIAAGAPWTGMLLGVVGEVAATFLVLLLIGSTLVTPLCNRG